MWSLNAMLEPKLEGTAVSLHIDSSSGSADIPASRYIYTEILIEHQFTRQNLRITTSQTTAFNHDNARHQALCSKGDWRLVYGFAADGL